MAWSEGICPGCNYRHDSDDFVADLCVYCIADLSVDALTKMLQIGILDEQDAFFVREILEEKTATSSKSSV